MQVSFMRNSNHEVITSVKWDNVPRIGDRVSVHEVGEHMAVLDVVWFPDHAALGAPGPVVVIVQDPPVQ